MVAMSIGMSCFISAGYKADINPKEFYRWGRLHFRIQNCLNLKMWTRKTA